MNIILDTNTIVGVVTAALVIAVIKGVFNISRRVDKIETAIKYDGYAMKEVKERLAVFESVCVHQHNRPIQISEGD